MKITHIYSKKFIAISAFASLLYGVLAMVASVHPLCALGISALLFLSIFWRFKMPDVPWWGKQILMIGASIIVFITVQFAVGTHLYGNNIIKILLNVAVVYGLIVIISAITTSIKAGIISVFVFSLLLAIIDHFVVQTRSYEIQFSDIKAISTAMTVAGGYEYTINPYCAGALFASLPILILLVTNKFPRLEGLISRTVNPLIGSALIALTVIIVSTSAGSDMINYRVKYWMYRTTQYNGFYLGLIKSITASSIEMPEGYTVETLVEGLEGTLGKDATDDVGIDTEKSYPNVIVIMNETFSDLDYASSAFGNSGIPTNVDPLEYFNSFSDSEDNVIKGYAYASIFGGNTANSEFEFLTGNSMAFIERTTVPYNNLLGENNTYSIIDIFNQYGYYTVGMHPEVKTNWSRHKVYDYFGFDEEYFLRGDNTFVDTEKLTDEQLYRGHVSDKTVYEKIIGLYENKMEGVPFFTFAVTMHNHGGFKTEDFDYTVTATDSEFPQLNEYLSSIKRSDEDLKTLIDYFKSVDEETVIVFFGDHQPSLNSEVYEQYFGLEGDDPTEDTMCKYLVPYMIWTNGAFGQEQGTGHTTSLNYLSSRVLDLIGLEKTAYLKLVQRVEQTIPAINAFGWWDSEYNFHTIDKIATIDTVTDGSEMTRVDEDVAYKNHKLPIIMLYYWTEYNMLKDDDNRLNEYFVLNYGKSKEEDYTDFYE